MKFILTVYICSLISGECVIPQDKEQDLITLKNMVHIMVVFVMV
jgi:hypothetical protein